MEVVNHTPFQQLLFETADPRDRRFGVLVIRGSFRIVAGQALEPLAEQEPLLVVDEHRGCPAKSSIKFASDLAPFKPSSDLHFNAVAHAPGGRLVRQWYVRIRIGKLTTALRIVGPHEWRRGGVLSTWKHAKPAPCAQVPLHYELSYGGSSADGKRVATDPRNPVGQGFIHPRVSPRDKPVAGPQIVGIHDRIDVCDDFPLPRGVGPIGPDWKPRIDLAGTFDPAWVRNRWPVLPEDFDYRYHNSAHPDLIYPGHLQGDEDFVLEGLHPERILRGKLPSYFVFGSLLLDSQKMVPMPCHLDTACFDIASTELAEHRVYLTWRRVFPMSQKIRLVETRLLGAKATLQKPTPAPRPALITQGDLA